jgi:hypothetical protein
MEYEGSLPCSQEAETGSYSESNDCRPQPTSLKSILILSLHLRLYFQVFSFHFEFYYKEFISMSHFSHAYWSPINVTHFRYITVSMSMALWSLSFYYFLKSPVSLSLLVSIVNHSTLFSNTSDHYAYKPGVSAKYCYSLQQKEISK